MHASQKFEHFVETYRRPDGQKWGGQDLHDATGGVVTRSYVTNLRKGRVENPGLEKMAAIAKAMGFPPSLWFEEGLGGEGPAKPDGDARGIAGRVEHLLGAIKNPSTDERYTNAEVARASLGDLTEEEVEGIRGGGMPDPTVRQVAALARVFGVPPSYLLDRGESPLDEELLLALRDDTLRAITREGLRLPKRERKVVLGIIRQFGETQEPEGGMR